MFNIYPTISNGEKVIIEFFLQRIVEKAYLEVINHHGFVLWLQVLEDIEGYHRIDWKPPPHFNGMYKVRLRNQYGEQAKELVITR